MHKYKKNSQKCNNIKNVDEEDEDVEFTFLISIHSHFENYVFLLIDVNFCNI